MSNYEISLTLRVHLGAIIEDISVFAYRRLSDGMGSSDCRYSFVRLSKFTDTPLLLAIAPTCFNA